MDIAQLGIEIRSHDAARAARDLDQFSKAGDRAERSATGFGEAARSALGGLAAAFAGVSFINTVREFDASMSQVAALSGASGKELTRLRDIAKEMGSTTSFSASQAADALGFLSMAGLTASESVTALPAILDVAKAGAMDLATTADIATNVMSGFGLEVSELARVGDVLAAGAASANTSLAQLGAGMSYAAPVAKSLGVSLEDTSAAMMVLADSGVQGERGGTTLRSMFSKLIQPSDKAKGLLREFGLTAADVNLESLSLAEVLSNLAEANIDLATANELVGLEAGSNLLTLVAGTEKYQDYANALREAEGAAGSMAKIMGDDVNGAFKGLGSAVEGLIIELGDSGATGAIKGTVEAFTSLIRGVTAMPDLGPIAMGFGLVAAGAIVMASPIVAASAAITGFAAGVAFLYQNWGTFASSFPGLAGAIQGGVNAVTGALRYLGERAREGMAALNAAFSGQGTRALVLYLSAIVDDARAFGADLAASMLEAGQGAVRNLSESFSSIDIEQAAIEALNSAAGAIERLTGIEAPDSTRIGTFVDIVSDAANRVKETAGATLSSLASGVSSFASAFNGKEISDQVMRNFAGGLRSIGEAAGTLGGLQMLYFKQLGEGIGLVFGNWDQDAADGFGSWLGDLAEGGLSAVGTGFEAFGRGLNVVVSALSGFITQDWGAFKEARKQFAEFLSLDGESLKRVMAAQALLATGNVSGALEVFKTLGEDTAVSVEDAAGRVEAAMTKMGDALSADSTASLTSAVEEFETGVSSLQDLKESVDGLMSGIAADGVTGQEGNELLALREIRKQLDEIISLAPRADTALAAVGDGGGLDQGASEEAAKKLKASIQEVNSGVEAAKKNIASMEAAVQPVTQAITATIDGSNTQVATWATDMRSHGAAASQNLADGIQSGQPQIEGAVKSSVQGGVNAAESASGQMEEAGRNLMRGLGAGIEAEAGAVAERAATAVFGAIARMKEAAEIKSPSRVAMRIGADLMGGLAIGIQSGAGGVADLAGAASGDIIGAVNDHLTGAQGSDAILDGLTQSLRDSAEASRSSAAAKRAEAAAYLEANQATAANTAQVKANAAGSSQAASSATRLASAVNQVKGRQDGVKVATDGVTTATKDAKDLMQQFGEAGKSAADQVAKSMEQAGQSIEKTGNGIMSVLDPIIAGFEKGDLSNIGQEFLAAARSSFFSSLRSWIGGLGRGGSGTLPGTSAPTSSLRPVARGQAQGRGLLGGLFGGGRGLGGLFGGGGGGLGGIFSGIMPVIGAISTAINFFKTKTTVLDQGVTLDVGNMTSLMQSYEKVEKSRFMGLSRKVSTSYDPIFGGAADDLQQAVVSIQTSISDAAKSIGISSDVFEDFSWSVKLSGGSAEDIQDSLEGMAEAYASLGLAGYDVIRSGETAKDTLDALSTSLSAVNQAFDGLGLAMMEVSVLSADAARSIVDGFGDVDGFLSATEYYFDNFYSAGEKMSVSLESLIATLSDAGVNVVPRNVAQFRELVSALSDAGLHEAVATMISAGPAFVAYSDGVKGTYDQTVSLIDNMLRGIDRALRSASLASEATLREFDRSLAFLRAGDISDLDAVNTAIDGVTSVSASMFSTAAEYRHAQNSARAALENIEGSGNEQIDRLNDMVAGLWSVDEGVSSIEDGIAKLTEQVASFTGYDSIDAVIASAQVAKQISDLQGELSAVMDITAPKVLSNDDAAVNHTTGGNYQIRFTDGSVRELSLGSDRQSDSTVAAYARANFQPQIAEEILAERDAMAEALRAQIVNLGGVPAFAGGGHHVGGLRIVGERGPELEATGPARYWTATQTRGMIGGDSDAAKELRELRAELAERDRVDARRAEDLLNRVRDLLDIELRREVVPQTVTVEAS